MKTLTRSLLKASQTLHKHLQRMIDESIHLHRHHASLTYLHAMRR